VVAISKSLVHRPTSHHTAPAAFFTHLEESPSYAIPSCQTSHCDPAAMKETFLAMCTALEQHLPTGGCPATHCLQARFLITLFAA